MDNKRRIMRRFTLDHSRKLMCKSETGLRSMAMRQELQSLYLLYTPLLVKAVHAQWFGGSDLNNFSLHMLLLAACRLLVNQIGVTLSRLRYLSSKHEIQKKGITFASVDLSHNWEDYILLSTLLMAVTNYSVPAFGGRTYPVWSNEGLLIMFLLHIGPTEAVYYWAHRALHHHYMYNRYHSHHHSLFITEANSGSVHPFAEHLMYALIFSIPLSGTWVLGGMSLSVLYAYPRFMDIVNVIGHCNVEFFPERLFQALPVLKYLMYTPMYHSLHHSQVHTNFCLSIPLYGYMGGTVDKNTDSLFHSVRAGEKERSDFVYLTHGTKLLHMFHIVLGIQSFSAMPYSAQWFLWPLYPLAALLMGLLWAFGQPFAVDKYRLPANSLQGETWVMARYNFQYSLPSERNRINKFIKDAIHMAEQEGVRVISLGALNKDESLNGGGQLFVAKNKNVRVRVVTGDTLTAAIVLDRLSKDVKEVFLTGSSEVSLAIAIYLCRQGVRVLMRVPLREHFEKIEMEIPNENQRCLVHVTKYQAGQQCPVWILGESADAKDQKWALPGTQFHQFSSVAEPLVQTRQDCTYGQYPAMQVPHGIKGLRTCEISMPREVVHPCHTGGLIHSLEGWGHNEVGPIEVDSIDKVWEPALKHGF